MAMMPSPLTVVTTRRTLNTTGVMKTIKQAASNPNNDWGVDRILLLNTETPAIPPAVSEVVTMVRLDELIGIHVVAGMHQRTM